MVLNQLKKKKKLDWIWRRWTFETRCKLFANISNEKILWHFLYQLKCSNQEQNAMPLSETAGKAEMNVTEIDGGCSQKKKKTCCGLDYAGGETTS